MRGGNTADLTGAGSLQGGAGLLEQGLDEHAKATSGYLEGLREDATLP